MKLEFAAAHTAASDLEFPITEIRAALRTRKSVTTAELRSIREAKRSAVTLRNTADVATKDYLVKNAELLKRNVALLKQNVTLANALSTAQMAEKKACRMALKSLAK